MEKVEKASGHTNTLFVRGIDPTLQEGDLISYLEHVGTVKSLEWATHGKDRLNKEGGISTTSNAFITMDTVFDAERVVDLMNFAKIGRSELHFTFGGDVPTFISGANRIAIQNLEKTIDCLALHDTFSVFGAIVDCGFLDTTSKKANNAFVQFQSKAAAQSAIMKVNGNRLNEMKVNVFLYDGPVIENIPFDPACEFEPLPKRAVTVELPQRRESISGSSETASILQEIANKPGEERKRILGERLLPMIVEILAAKASKITGMLLELDNSELLYLIESKNAGDLKNKVDEALDVLSQASQ